MAGYAYTALQTLVKSIYNKLRTYMLSREQVILWAYEAGFPTNYARNEIARFEAFARLIERHVNSDIYKEEQNGND